MQGSKIQLSPAEAALFSDAQMILTKNSILQKTVMLLEEVQNELLLQAPSFLRELSPSPKISRGENYLGLPYVILDYPRLSNGEDLFFVRSMFWWGNFFSSTLQLSGNYKQQFTKQLGNAYDLFAERNYSVGINADPWNHHFGKDNYQTIDSLSAEAFTFLLEENAHIKIAASWPLKEWDMAANKLIESWKFLVSLIA
jgi:hypothetical protein